MKNEKPLQQIIDEVWPSSFGEKPDVSSITSHLGVIMLLVDQVVKQRILEACEEEVEYEKIP